MKKMSKLSGKNQSTLLTMRTEYFSPQPPELSSTSTCVTCIAARIAASSSSGVTVIVVEVMGCDAHEMI